MSLELARKLAVGMVILRHHNHTCGILINPVDNAWPDFPTDSRQIAAVTQKGINQGPGEISCALMHNHTGGLVHHDYITVFMKYFKRYHLRERQCREWRRNPHDKAIPPFQPEGRLLW